MVKHNLQARVFFPVEHSTTLKDFPSRKLQRNPITIANVIGKHLKFEDELPLFS